MNSRICRDLWLSIPLWPLDLPLQPGVTLRVKEPHSSNERTPEEWACARFHAQMGIYQIGRERMVRAHLTPALNSSVCEFWKQHGPALQGRETWCSYCSERQRLRDLQERVDLASTTHVHRSLPLAVLAYIVSCVVQRELWPFGFSYIWWMCVFFISLLWGLAWLLSVTICIPTLLKQIVTAQGLRATPSFLSFCFLWTPPRDRWVCIARTSPNRSALPMWSLIGLAFLLLPSAPPYNFSVASDWCGH